MLLRKIPSKSYKNTEREDQEKKLLATHTSKAFKRYASEKRTEALRFDTIKQFQRWRMNGLLFDH